MSRRIRDLCGLLLVWAAGAFATPTSAQAPATAAAPAAPDSTTSMRHGGVAPNWAGESGSLTLRAALSLALTHSPALSFWPADLRALEADARQAGRRPNPQAGALVENIATDELESTLQISHLVELGGKRGRRVALARAGQSVAAWAFESARADVVALTARRFVGALAAQEHVAIRRELVRVAEDALAAVSARVRAGGASSVEELRAQLALETTRVELASMEREQAIAYQRLAGMWGHSTPLFAGTRGDLTSVTPPAPRDTLLARIELNPDVARWAAEISWREAARAQARAMRVPDLTLEGGVRRLNASDDTGFLVGVGIPIPIFDRAQDATTAADLRIQSANTQRHSARLEASIQLGIAYEEATAGLAEYRQLRDDLLPKARNAAEAASSAYRSGLLRLTDVLDVQRALFEVRIRTVEALVRYHTAAFEIERLTGLPVAASNTKEQE